MPIALSRLQHNFWQLIVAPVGVSSALSGLATHDSSAVPLENWIDTTATMSAVERVDVYANMYFHRLLEVLRGDYRKVLSVVGDAAFNNLVTDYLLVHPSSSPSIRDAGARLPAFLRHHSLSTRHPFLYDLAQLEWAWVEVFDRENVPALDRADLETLAPEEWASLGVYAVPATRLIHVEFSVDKLFAALERGETSEVQRDSHTLLIWRRDFSVWMRATEPGEAALIARALEGCSLAELCEQLRASSESDQVAAQRALATLMRWLDAALLMKPSRPSVSVA